MEQAPPKQQITAAPLKRARARQSCTRCRKQKLKCSGEVPCVRCVSRGLQDKCELWHRITGGPKDTGTAVFLETLEPCGYYSDVLQKLSLNLAQQGKPAPDLLVQLARLWLMVAVHQKGVNTEFAKEEIARSTMIPITSMIQPKVRAAFNYLSGSLFVCLLPIHLFITYASLTCSICRKNKNHGHPNIVLLRSNGSLLVVRHSKEELRLRLNPLLQNQCSRWHLSSHQVPA